MGHDIFAARTSADLDEKTQNVVAALVYGATNPRSIDFYRALDCEELSGGVSGIGARREFTVEQIRWARFVLVERNPAEGDKAEQERDFLDRILAVAEELGHVWIEFF